jgi:hypothetical protein
VAASGLGPELQPLAEVAQSARLGVLLGAGASMSSGLPSWDNLSVRLLGHAGAIGDPSTARAYLARQDPLLVAEAARAASSDWAEDVRGALYDQREDEYFPTSLHLAVANLAVSWQSNLSVLTLNFDDLLEQAVRDACLELDLELPVVARTAAAPRAPVGSLEVQHLHGYLPRSRAEDDSPLVLTLSDFNQLTTTPNPWQASAITEAVTQGPLLLAGTTYRDVDIRQWLHTVAEQTRGGRHRVAALVARQGLGLTRSQFTNVAEAVKRQWAAIGIDVVLLEDHADAAQVLRELPTMSGSDYCPPRERVDRLWKRLEEDFHAAQVEFSERLDGNRAVLPLAPGEDADLTLWLANGSGQLARWTSHDRIYRAPSKLRWIPTGYDSPWAAARALAQNEIIIERPDAAAPMPRRWRSVIAAPVLAHLPGGPNLAVGALSAGVSAELVLADEVSWRTAFADLVEDWGTRLEAKSVG